MNAEERGRLISERKEVIQNRKERLWAKDDWQPFDVYRVPVDALLLNVDNRRFAAERQLMEQKLGHALDPENSPDDERSVIAILLDTSLEVDGNIVVGQPSSDYEALKTDWSRRKQERPFWIRPDGTVRNGNRRLAMLKRMRQGGSEGTEWVDAIILDPNRVDEQELFEMEQREQLTEDFKVRYTDINLLLALRDAATSKDIDWADLDSLDRVAGELQNVAGGDKSYALIQLQAIRYMDAFLRDSNAEGKHYRLVRQVERFRDVGKAMAKIEAEYPDAATDMLRITFAAIRAGNPHGDIRMVRKIFIEDKDRFRSLLTDIERDEEGWEPPADSQLENPSLAADVEPESDEVEADSPGPVVRNYPSEKVRTRIKNAIDGFMAASTLDVSSTLEQVLSRLSALSSDPDRLPTALSNDTSGEIRGKLKRVIEWARDAEHYLADK